MIFKIHNEHEKQYYGSLGVSASTTFTHWGSPSVCSLQYIYIYIYQVKMFLYSKLFIICAVTLMYGIITHIIVDFLLSQV